MYIKEDFLHYLWQYQYFDKNNLICTDGSPLVIYNNGLKNNDAGPDFTDAVILRNGAKWAGTVELHVRASQWNEHKHQFNPAYNNVVLHVVWEDDRPVYRQDGSLLPALELKNRTQPSILYKYSLIGESEHELPCQRLWQHADSASRQKAVQSGLYHRLNDKARETLLILQQNNNDWEETAYQLIGRNFGFHTNSPAFYALCQSLPLKILHKHRGHELSIEALLFGHAGFLESEQGDAYFLALRKEYLYLSAKYQLYEKRLPASIWKHARLRPANFPELRLAAFASFINKTEHLFSSMLDMQHAEELCSFFSIQLPAYWQQHVGFGKKSTKVIRENSKSTAYILAVNAFISLWAAWCERQPAYFDRLLSLLETLPPEDNRILRLMDNFSVHQNALHSQGLTGLYKLFCSKKKCTSCELGKSLLRPADEIIPKINHMKNLLAAL